MKTPIDYRIDDILTSIENDLPQSPNIKEMAIFANLSVSRLQHIFKREVGISIGRHIINSRLEKARMLLETTNLRIKEICCEICYSDFAHFVRDFKRAFGSYPTKYRFDFRSRSTKRQ